MKPFSEGEPGSLGQGIFESMIFRVSRLVGYVSFLKGAAQPLNRPRIRGINEPP